MRGPANQGVGVVQVPDVDAEEVGEPDDRGRGKANTPFGNLAEEVGRGGEGPAGGGTQGRGGHSVQHPHGPVGGGADVGKPVDRPVALGDEHGEGVMGRQLGGPGRGHQKTGARLVRRPARSMPQARLGKWPRSPGSHWVSSIRSIRFISPAGVSVGGTWRQALCPRTSPYT